MTGRRPSPGDSGKAQERERSGLLGHVWFGK